MTSAKSEVRSSKSVGDLDTSSGPLLVTRRGLALALGVSLRTVERMLHDEEIEPVRLRGWSVRFHVPDVVRRLVGTAVTRKHGRGVGVERESVGSVGIDNRQSQIAKEQRLMGSRRGEVQETKRTERTQGT